MSVLAGRHRSPQKKAGMPRDGCRQTDGDGHQAAAQDSALQWASSLNWELKYNTENKHLVPYCSKKLQDPGMQGSVLSLLFSGPVQRSLGKSLFCWPKHGGSCTLPPEVTECWGLLHKVVLNILWENKRQTLNLLPLSSGWWHVTSVQSEWGPLCIRCREAATHSAVELCFSSSVLAEYNKLLNRVSSSLSRGDGSRE